MQPEPASSKIPWLPLLGVGLAVGLIWTFSVPIEHWIAENERAFTAAMSRDVLETQSWLLLPTAFVGGLIASLSPCILALLPANLSYIGTLNPESRPAALCNALLFVFGVVTVLSLFGLVSSFAGKVIVDFKGYVHLTVGLMSIAFALGMLGLFRIRVPEGAKELPKGAGPYLVGFTFALVTSPCASPVLFTLLTASGSSGNTPLTVATMASYAFGYSAVVFVSSLVTGFVRQISRMKQHAEQINRAAAILLLLVGLYYAVAGVYWFIS